MQHPDEGMIHTWLDGQLSADEAAEFEAHLAECPQCAAKVAEERGLVAGATRILTALDNVPGDVIPITKRPKRFSRGFLQAAAAVLLVVTGGVIAVRVSGNDIQIPTAATVAPVDTQSAALPSTVVRAPSTIPTVASATVTPESKTATVSAHSVSKPSSANTAVAADARRAVEPSAPPPTATIAQANRSFAPATATGAVASPLVAPAPPPPVQKPRGNDTTDVDIVLSRDQLQLQAVVTTGVASTAPKLSVVRTDYFDGGRVILLRTDAGRVVTLMETATPPAQIVSKAVPEAQSANGIVGARGTASSTRAVLARTSATVPRTIRWRDAKTGKFYSLTGAFSDEELQRMRVAIEADSTLRK